MGCGNLLSGPNSNHRLETTVYRPAGRSSGSTFRRPHFYRDLQVSGYRTFWQRNVISASSRLNPNNSRIVGGTTCTFPKDVIFQTF